MLYSIRAATAQDLTAIQAIFNAEILHGFATWQHQSFELHYYQDFFQQLKQHGFPLLVAEHQQTQNIMGYAYYGFFRNIAGFGQTVEHSVFVRPEYAGRGLGSKLLNALIAHAKQQGLHIMVAAIDHENLHSIYLHQKCGFIQTGYMPQVGQKFGQWRDLVLMQLNLQQHQSDD